MRKAIHHKVTKKTFDLILIEVILIGTTWKLFKLCASRHSAGDEGSFSTQVAKAVVGL